MEEDEEQAENPGVTRRASVRRLAWRPATVMVGAGALAVGMTGAASAGASTSAGVTPGLSPANASISNTVAAYNIAPNVGFGSASATVVVPKLTCTSKTLDAGQFFGLFDTDPTIGSGAAHAVAAVSVTCGSSGPT